jgi:hypothetical protein
MWLVWLEFSDQLRVNQAYELPSGEIAESTGYTLHTRYDVAGTPRPHIVSPQSPPKSLDAGWDGWKTQIAHRFFRTVQPQGHEFRKSSQNQNADVKMIFAAQYERLMEF